MIVVDLFAGAGGSSEGARQAGATVAWAANHWPLAVEVHQRNHTDTDHVCQDLHQCDWASVPRCDGVLASPACQGHSNAASHGGRRGSLPRHDADRSTAWAVVSCLEATRAAFAVVENVVEFRRWAIFPSWLDAMSRLGYTAAEHVIDAVDLGVPQRRRRLFVTLTRSTSPLLLDLQPVAPRPAWSVSDERGEGWRSVDLLPPAARRRILAAAQNNPGDHAFVVNYVSDDRGHSVDEPLRTITTKHQRAWVRRGGGGCGLQRRMFSSIEYARAMGFPDRYLLTGGVSADCRLLGNAVCPPVMRAILEEIGRRA